MPGYIWKRDNDGKSHLEEDVLLAYTRGQVSADIVLLVQQHCAKCTVCEQKCAEYMHTGTTLQQNLAYTMPVYPSIVDMLGNALDNPAAASAALRQRRENKRRVRKQRVRTSGSKSLHLFPKVGAFPLTISVSLVMLMVLLTYTLTNYISSRASSGHSTPPTVSTVPVQPTATQRPTPTKTVNTSISGTTAGVGATPTGTTTSADTSKPVIWICSSNADLAQSRLRICGKNFKAGDKVTILEALPGIGYKVGMQAIADAHGSINGAWTIQNCHSVPSALFAYVQIRRLATQPIPVTVSIGGCRSPNVKPYGR
ncbi:MAG: hypothetical protein ABI406_19915 [Ktedonobacteraceae bacterium]